MEGLNGKINNSNDKESNSQKRGQFFCDGENEKHLQISVRGGGLQSDSKSFLESSLSFQKLKFEERVRNSFQKNLPNPLSLAQPNSNYCQICQTHFDQYLTHINNSEHQIANRKSQANQMISELCQQYRIATKKTKPISKQVERTWMQEEPENVRVLRSCRKKATTDETMGKYFSFISTKINTSHLNGL